MILDIGLQNRYEQELFYVQGKDVRISEFFRGRHLYNVPLSRRRRNLHLLDLRDDRIVRFFAIFMSFLRNDLIKWSSVRPSIHP